MLLFFAQGSALTASSGLPSTGLKLWLKADAGISKTGSNVTAWADQSGNGNNATTVGSPQFNASSINGLPGVTIATGLFGASQTITGTASILPDDSARTVICVLRKNADGASSWGSILAFRKSAPGVGLYTGNSINNLTVTGSTHNYTSAFAPSASTNYVLQWNAASTTSGNPTFSQNHSSVALSGVAPLGSEAGGAAGFYLGALRTDGLVVGLYADICEFAVWDHVLTGGEQAQADAYILSRYGL